MDPEEIEVELPEDALMALDQAIQKAQKAKPSAGEIRAGLEEPLQSNVGATPMAGAKTVKLVIAFDQANNFRENMAEMIEGNPGSFGSSTIDRNRPGGP